MKTLVISLKLFLFFTIITGIVYPLLITGIAQVVFPSKANGSLILKGKQAIGSELIGQQFNSPVYFSSRPSAIAYNPLPSGGSNYGLTNPKLKQQVDERHQQFLAFNHLDSTTDVPAEMLFASGSGLDPHISPRAALLQVNRVAKARNFNDKKKQKLEQLVKQHTEIPQFLCFGEARVNVLNLNIAVDSL